MHSAVKTADLVLMDSNVWFRRVVMSCHAPGRENRAKRTALNWHCCACRCSSLPTYRTVGDLGRFNPITGDLIVTGRAKDTIVLSNGENVEPQPLEVRDSCLLKGDFWVVRLVLLGQQWVFSHAFFLPGTQEARRYITVSARSSLGIHGTACPRRVDWRGLAFLSSVPRSESHFSQC